MSQLFHTLALLGALVVLAAIALTSLAVDAGDELTERQARVLCAAMKAIEHVAIAYGTALAAQNTPLTLAMKAVMLLLR
ncbi:hypothetical protein SM007_28100 [Streptomyces avermitilis]|uniref:Uncharacterized protein n=1 Tax=Streptomyces avermitilis TaxID=33903 RepID=A0A4D4MAF8_STRAX|nr:hypothetical protein [Streptomyces avermitilis]OOV24733.1 hypothetical protein SM007_28100 [Streptomyces avermitilis]GDY68855.1 hypothetical protein SAV14893_082480 [Streptomyces avermitilis]GDY70763.1 hypothetical protein SAV31267_002480 [Streptomyces avermitilis]